MPIKNSITGTVDHLINYTPFDLRGEVLEENIQRMFSYDLVPSTTTKVDYYFGAAESKIYDLRLKNLTKNALLTVEIFFNPALVRLSDSVMLLDASQEKIITVFVNPSMNTYTVNVDTMLNFKIVYEYTGDLVYKNAAMTEYVQAPAPDAVTIFN